MTINIFGCCKLFKNKVLSDLCQKPCAHSPYCIISSILMLELSAILSIVINIVLFSFYWYYHMHVYSLVFDLLYNWNYFVFIPLTIFLCNVAFDIHQTDSFSWLYRVLQYNSIIICSSLLPIVNIWVSPSICYWKWCFCSCVHTCKRSFRSWSWEYVVQGPEVSSFRAY
jgi:hypothetical protein